MTIDPRKKYWLVERPYGRLGVQSARGIVWLHSDIWEWSKVIAKDAKVCFKALLDHLRKHGVERVYSGVPEADKLVNKFQQIHGMRFVKSEQGVNIYSLEL